MHVKYIYSAFKSAYICKCIFAANAIIVDFELRIFFLACQCYMVTVFPVLFCFSLSRIHYHHMNQGGLKNFEPVINFNHNIYLRNKNVPECIVEFYKHARIFKNTRELHREAQGAAECFSHFRVCLKIPKCLIT